MQKIYTKSFYFLVKTPDNTIICNKMANCLYGLSETAVLLRLINVLKWCECHRWSKGIVNWCGQCSVAVTIRARFLIGVADSENPQNKPAPQLRLTCAERVMCHRMVFGWLIQQCGCLLSAMPRESVVYARDFVFPSTRAGSMS